MTYNEILSRFKVKRRSGDKSQCICPAHNDQEASLTISKGDKGTVVHCHAGCETADVLGAVGLSLKDLFDDDPIQTTTGERWRSYVEGREKRKIEDVYPYFDCNGKYAFTRIRLSGKKFIYGIMDGDRFNYGLKGKSRKSIPAVFCESLTGLRRAIEKGDRVFYCEGEKDVKTVNSHGLTGITCGASGDWVEGCATLFEGADVVILQDNDDPGRKSAKAIEKDLRKVAKSVRIVVPTPDLEHGDISDFFKDHSVEDLEELLKEEPKEDDHGDDLDLDQFHLINDKGRITGVFDLAIFQYLKTEKDLFVLGGVPYMYKDGVYRGDVSGANLKTAISKLIYPELDKSSTEERVYRLFLNRTELQVSYEEINQYPQHWINFRNGFYDPVAQKMIPHDPKYRAINQIPHDYDPSAQLTGTEVEKWLQFIVPEKDDREMLLQYMGYCLTRDTRQQKFMILYGSGGSGKSTVIRLIESMIGAENISNISLKELSQRFASYGLLGKTLNSCADLEVSALEDTSVIKKILGEDSLRGEPKGKQDIYFKNYAKLIFSTNELPLVISEKTNGFYRRLLILNMTRQPEHKRADYLDLLKGELDYLIRLSVKALERMYQAGLITESAGSVEAVQSLRNDSDTVEAWISEECSRVKGAKEERGKLYQKYVSYCDSTDRTSLSRNNFYRSLRMKDFREKMSMGIRYFEGISLEKSALKSALDDDEKCSEWTPVGDQMDLPFN